MKKIMTSFIGRILIGTLILSMSLAILNYCTNVASVDGVTGIPQTFYTTLESEITIPVCQWGTVLTLNIESNGNPLFITAQINRIDVSFFSSYCKLLLDGEMILNTQRDGADIRQIDNISYLINSSHYFILNFLIVYIYCF